MVEEDNSQAPIPVTVTEQPADQPDPSPVSVTEPAAATESQVVVLSDEQFSQLRDLGVYQMTGIWTLIGILVIMAFWSGWRSTK